MTGIDSLDLLIEQFSRLPGVGRKSAQRMAFAVLKYSPEELDAFTAAVRGAKEKIHACPLCHNMTDTDLCPICADATRDHGVICVVEDSRAVMAFERVRSFRGV
jgi:recombination protein RecR